MRCNLVLYVGDAFVIFEILYGAFDRMRMDAEYACLSGERAPREGAR